MPQVAVRNVETGNSTPRWVVMIVRQMSPEGSIMPAVKVQARGVQRA